MARLRNVQTGLEVKLVGRSLVGRSHLADLRLVAKGASNEHATIIWDGLLWTLRDLTSRNGTRINQTLLSGQSWRLTTGDEIMFGDPAERWCWLDGAAPNASAARADGRQIDARDGLLLLPDEEAPRASVYVRDDQWEAEVEGSTRVVADGDSLSVDGEHFVLRLPSLDPAAHLTRTFQGHDFAGARVSFKVSPDEEYVVVQFETSRETATLPARSFNYMLLVLARARVEDTRSGCSSEDAGWLYSQDLARKLNTSVESLNVDVHRARRAATDLGVIESPMNIVERRRTTGQIRLGIANISL